MNLSASDKFTSGDTSSRGCVLESITPCGVLTDADPHRSGCKQASLALPSSACCLNQRSALSELSATQAAVVSTCGAPSHSWRACSSALGSVSWPLRLSLVLGPIIFVLKQILGIVCIFPWIFPWIFAQPSTVYGPLGISVFRSCSLTSADVRGVFWEEESLFSPVDPSNA